MERVDLWRSATAYSVSVPVAAQWQVDRVDLWKVFKKPILIQALTLWTVGSPAVIDQVLLGCTELDLPAVRL